MVDVQRLVTKTVPYIGATAHGNGDEGFEKARGRRDEAAASV